MITVYAKNDLAFLVTLKEPNAEGKLEPLTDGTVTAFIATSNSPTATAADATLEVSATHVGNGRWLVVFDATALDATLLSSLFGSGTRPYIIVEHDEGVRVYLDAEYRPARPAD